MTQRSFASDNYSGVHPEILIAISQANQDHVQAYGDDPLTQKVLTKFKDLFGNETATYFVYGGTAANVLGLKSMTQSFHSIFCSESAHIHQDECGAPENFTGCKLIPIPTANGKLQVDLITEYIQGVGFEHHVQPGVISITQSTEYGTVYSPEEIQKIANFAHQNNMLVHMDGARIGNACAALDVSFRKITKDVGVDVLSFGGTKNGLMFGEAIVFMNSDLAQNFKYIRKQAMQLTSKMRFISAQFDALLSDELWLKNARHANAMAKYLESQIRDIPQIQITQKVQANAVFAILPPSIIASLQKKFSFYVWNEKTNEVRWMCSFDTQKEDIDVFVTAIKNHF